DQPLSAAASRRFTAPLYWRNSVIKRSQSAVTTMPESPEKNSALEKLPPPSFQLLIATYASQATVAFGHVANPIDGKKEIRPDLAKHAIDMLAILEEKTKGNLTPAEAAMLEKLLHELRFQFIDPSARK